MEELINKTLEYVKEFFKNEYSGHDFFHTLRVYNLARTIANNEECNLEIVCLSALLHDVDDYKLVGEQKEEFKNAKTFLKSINYNEEKINIICHNISQVSYKGKDSVVPDTIEGKIIQDADRLDAIGAMGISRTFAFGGNRNLSMYDPDIKPDDNRNYKEGSTVINHFYEKLLKLKDLMNTKTAKEIAIHRHQYMEEFLKEFYNEWDGIC